jgi:uncharacterized membrane protein
MDTIRSAAVRTVTPQQLSWLRTEVAEWQDSGLIEPAQASDILEHYRERGRTGVKVSLGRVLLVLGGAFVGIGLIWLVAANLDRLSPELRFLAVLVLWLAFLVGGETLDVRRASRAVVVAARLMAALAFGALVFQAAQSLQVPAYEPRLVGLWSAGALLHGYAVRAMAPFVVGVGTGVFWWIAQPMWVEPSGFGLVLLLGAGTVLAAAMAVLHDGRLEDQAWLWRFLAAALALVTMFAAAVPDVGADGVEWSSWLVLELALGAVAAPVALATRRGRASLEVVGALAVVLLSVLLAAWSTGTDPDSVDVADWGHAVVSVVAYVLLAVALVALGTVRDRPPLAWLAMAGLVVFTTFQSFAVFAPIVTGAWLFVVLGTVFLGTGYLFDRARRQLSHALENDTQSGAGR